MQNAKSAEKCMQYSSDLRRSTFDAYLILQENAKVSLTLFHDCPKASAAFEMQMQNAKNAPPSQLLRPAKKENAESAEKYLRGPLGARRSQA